MQNVSDDLTKGTKNEKSWLFELGEVETVDMFMIQFTVPKIDGPFYVSVALKKVFKFTIYYC